MTGTEAVSRIDIETDPAFAAFRAEKERERELNAKKTPLRSREKELRDSFGQAARGAQFDGTPMSAADQRKVCELLGDDDAVGQTEAELQAELRDVQDQLRVIALAVEQQRQRAETARQAGAKEIRTRLLPVHQALAKAIVEQLKQLHAALLAESDFRGKLDDKGIGWGAPLLPATILPLSAERCERVNFWLREFSQGDGRYKLS